MKIIGKTADGDLIVIMSEAEWGDPELRNKERHIMYNPVPPCTCGHGKGAHITHIKKGEKVILECRIGRKSDHPCGCKKYEPTR
jgi:hypothetical protein